MRGAGRGEPPSCLTILGLAFLLALVAVLLLQGIDISWPIQ